MDYGNCSPEQRSSQQERAFPTDRGNDLIRHGLIAPDERVPLFDHRSKKILILSGQKRRPERLSARSENAASQQDVPGPSLPPVDYQPGWVSRPFVELALNDPLWRIFVKVRLHWSKHTVHVIVVAGFKQSPEPAFARKLIVVDEGDKVSVCVLDGLVPGERDILPRFHAVPDRNTRRSRKIQRQRLSGSQLIVVGNHDRICK